MIRPTETRTVAAPGLSLDDFVPEVPDPALRTADPAPAERAADLIDGVTVTELIPHSDPRGSLCELLTTRDGAIEPIVHVYQVTAAPGSVRAWVFHRHQFDRLAFPNGRFEIVLFDIRPGSPTLNRLNVFNLGREQPALLRIPPLVVHGVRNIGSETAAFVNLPTRAYDLAAPDKCRLHWDDSRVPYVFDDR